MDTTLMIIKPDAVGQSCLGKILARIEEEGFQIKALRLEHLRKEQAQGFYAEHKERPFYESLVSFMISGPVLLGVLSAPEAVKKWRDLIGATDPAEAAENTVRKLYAKSKESNAVHGSDSKESAAREIAFFFGDTKF